MEKVYVLLPSVRNVQHYAFNVVMLQSDELLILRNNMYVYEMMWGSLPVDGLDILQCLSILQ